MGVPEKHKHTSHTELLTAVEQKVSQLSLWKSAVKDQCRFFHGKFWVLINIPTVFIYLIFYTYINTDTYVFMPALYTFEKGFHRLVSHIQLCGLPCHPSPQMWWSISISWCPQTRCLIREEYFERFFIEKLFFMEIGDFVMRFSVAQSQRLDLT